MPPTVGILLLVLDENADIPPIIQALTAQELRPILLPTVQEAVDLLARWQPQAVILRARQPGWPALLRLLAQRDIPCVLIGTSAQLHHARQQHAACVELLAPAAPEEIVQAVRLALGPASAGALPDRIDLGVIKLDLRTRTVELERRQSVLPPKEFELLLELALQPGVPLSAVELLRRVWPESPSAPLTTVHTRIWRLPRLLGDPQRPHPLIVNRRDAGYLLDIAGPPSH